MRYFDHSPIYYSSSFWPGGFISLLINIAIWALFIWLIMTLVRHFSSQGNSCCGKGGHSHEEDGPETVGNDKYLDIVKTRYAKGEINKEKFEELKKGLTE